ncbi:MAG: hypothetical protein BWY51_00047 [Parcubacteria group bacterium ADurb.Bin316]|nr:MAG: hypothetical protein BWY51_00047 [Parcubacteria group bacterium ADurb.Bin316]HOZ56010.1 hypothetical protein [bacterium]
MGKELIWVGEKCHQLVTIASNDKHEGVCPECGNVEYAIRGFLHSDGTIEEATIDSVSRWLREKVQEAAAKAA